MTEQKWKRRWNSWLAPNPSKPGVWRRKEGGFLVRGRAVNARTGKIKEVRFTAEVQDALEAFDPGWRVNFAPDRDYEVVVQPDGERAVIPRASGVA